MAGSEANRTALGIVEEVLLGVTPASPAWERLRMTGTTLAAKEKTEVSAELRPDRNVPDLILVGIDAEGDISQEVSMGALDTLLRGGMASEWDYAPVRDNAGGAMISAVSTTAYTLAATAGTPGKYNANQFGIGMLVRATGFGNAGNNRVFVANAGTSTSVGMTGGVVEASPPSTARLKQVGFSAIATGDVQASAAGLISTTLDFTTLSLKVGEWVKIGSTSATHRFVTDANNGWARISSIATNLLGFDVFPPGWTTDAAAGKTIYVWSGDTIRNGVIPRSYSIEKQFQDLAAPEYDVFTGQRVSSIEINADAQAILKATVTMMGMQATNSTTRTASSTDVAAPTNAVMNTSSNIGFLYENGGAIAGPNFVMSMRLRFDNTLRRQPGLASATSIGIGYGRFQVTGELNIYYGSNAILNKIRNNTSSAFAVMFGDPLGPAAGGLHFDVPRLKFTDGDPTTSGVDTDRMLTSPFQGILHPTLGYELQITKFDYWEV